MKSVLRYCCLSILWGTLVGLCMGTLKLLSNHYFQHGLTRLALHTLADAAWTYLAAALFGAILIILFRTAAGPIARRLGTVGAIVLGIGVLIAGTLPVWIWLLFHDIWVFPRSIKLVKAVLAGLILLNIPAYFIFIHRREKLLSASRRPLLGSAGICLALVLLLVMGARLAAPSVTVSEDHPNVFIILMDTVRVDRLSCYGYHRETTPEIDAFAREAIRFTEFYSTTSWTVPSHASLFTGLYAARHRATQEKWYLKNRFATLAEVLSDRGYRTWAISGNPFVGPYTNMNQGFQRFWYAWRPFVKWYYGKKAHHPNNVAFRRFLKRADRRKPFFAFINYVEAHGPYKPPRRYLDRVVPPETDIDELRKLSQKRPLRHYTGSPLSDEAIQGLSMLYDGEVSYVSHLVGDLLKKLRADGRYDDTLIILTSDHGESFGEHGLMGHAFGLYKTTVQVPLLIRLPKGLRAGEVTSRKAQLVDLFPTVLNACGIDHSSLAQHGRDIFSEPALSGEEGIFSEYYFPCMTLHLIGDRKARRFGSKLAPFMRRLRAYESDGYRVIWSSDGLHEFYDLTQDPRETVNLYDPQNPSALAREYLRKLERTTELYAEGIPFPAEPDLHSEIPKIEGTADSETIESLRSLGYVR